MNPARLFRVAFILTLTLMAVLAHAAQFNPDSLKARLPKTRGIEQINLLREIAGGYANSNISLSIKYDSLALQNANKIDDLKLQSDIMNNLAISYYMQSQYARSISLLNKSLAIKEAIQDTLEIVKTLNNLGVLYQVIGDYESAINLISRSMNIRRAQNDSVAIARGLSNLSNIYITTGKPDLAIEVLKEAELILSRLDTDDVLDAVYNNLGNAYQAKKDFQHAKKYFRISLSMKDSIADPRSAATTLNNLGLANEELGDHGRAKRYYFDALRLREKINDRQGIITTRINLGRLNRKDKEYGVAHELFHSALPKAIEDSLKEQMYMAYKQLSMLFAEQQMYDSAYYYLEDAHKMRGIIFSDELKKNLANMEYQQLTALMHQENELLRLDNEMKSLTIKRKQFNMVVFVVVSSLVFAVLVLTWLRFREKRELSKRLQETLDQLKVSHEKIAEENRTREKLLSIIAHDLRSPFNNIMGLSEIMAEMARNGQYEDLATCADAVNSSSRNTFTLLENLLEWSYSQTGNITFRPESLKVDEIIEAELLVQKEAATKKSITLELSCDPTLVFGLDRQMFRSIIRNLVSNAIKFSYTGGVVHILAYLDEEGMMLLEVQDEGIGISPDRQRMMMESSGDFQQPGTMNERGTGIGFMLCLDFTDHHGGNLSIESAEGKGTTVRIRFPRVLSEA